MSRTAFAAAKVNLFLHVGAPDTNGYHPICSLMTFADVGDRVTVTAAEALGLKVYGPFGGGLGEGDDNLVLRAARALIGETRRPLPPLGHPIARRVSAADPGPRPASSRRRP